MVKDHYEKKGNMDRAQTEDDLKFQFERILTSTNPSDIKELIFKGFSGSVLPKRPTRDFLAPNPDDPVEQSGYKSMVGKISDLFNTNHNHVKNNKNLAKNYQDFRTIAALQTVLSSTVKTMVAQIKHRDYRNSRQIDLTGREEQRKTMRLEKEEGINLIIKNWLLTILKAQWTKIIWKIKILWAIRGLMEARERILQRQMLLTFNVIKIQRYFKKRILWRMMVNPGRLSLVIVKGGLSMYAELIQQKVVRSNVYKLVRYFPRFVSVLKIKYLIGEYIQRQTSAIYRMREHMSNMKVNGHEFAKNFDKAVLNLIQFEYDLKKEVPKGATFYNLSNNMHHLGSEMKNKLFWAIYNIKLLDYLKHHYYRKVNNVRRGNAEDQGLSYDNLDTDDEIPEDGLNDLLPKGFPEDRKFKHIMKFPYLYKKIKENWCSEIYMVANKKYKDKAFDSYLNQRQSEQGNASSHGKVTARGKTKTTLAKAGPVRFSTIDKNGTPQIQVKKATAHAISPFAGENMENVSPSLEDLDSLQVETKPHVSILFLIKNREVSSKGRLIRNSRK